MDYTVHGILPDRILEWVAISSSRGSSQTRDRNQLSFIAGRFLTSHKGSPEILEWVAYPFSSGSFWPRNQTNVSCFAGRFLTNWVTREATKRNESEIKMLYEQYLPSIITRWNFLSSSFQASGLYMPGRKEIIHVFAWLECHQTIFVLWFASLLCLTPTWLNFL